MPDGSATLRPREARQFDCPLHLLHASRTDPRGGDVGDLSDLDVGEPGPDGKPIPIFEALLVRVWPTDDQRYEIVFGHRRVAKARKMGLATAPIEVRDLSDEEVRFLQLREVIQRAQLTPMQEALAFGSMRDDLKLPSKEIAARLNVSARHVNERLLLLGLCGDAEAALRSGAISLGVAIDLTTISDLKKQARAVPKVRAMTAAKAKEWIKRTFHLSLVSPGFDPEDPTLVKGEPACSKCPKNTAVQADLFEPDATARCLDAACYRSKQAAAKARRAAESAPASTTDAPSETRPAAPPKTNSLAAKIQELTEQRLLNAITAAAATQKNDARFLRFLTALALRGTLSADLDSVCSHHAVEDAQGLLRAAEQGNEELLRGLIVEALIAPHLHGEMREIITETDGVVDVACRFLGIDGERLCDEAEADAKDAAKPKPTKAEKAAQAAAEKEPPKEPPAPSGKIPIKVVAFMDAVADIVSAGAQDVADLWVEVAVRAGVAKLSPSARKVLETAIEQGVRVGRFERRGDGLIGPAEAKPS